MEETIKQHLWWPSTRQQIWQLVDRFKVCQFDKKRRLKYRHMPPKEAEVLPWTHLCVDTNSPYGTQCKGQKDLEFQAVAFIDPATGWFEMK